MIHEPLAKYVNIAFADHVMDKFNKVIESYLSLMQRVYLDGVDAKTANQYLDQFFLTFLVAAICEDTLSTMGLTPKEVALSGHPLLYILLHHQESFPQNIERIRIWSKGDELPDLTSIAALETTPSPKSNGEILKNRLVMGRLWDYFFYRSSRADLSLLKSHSLAECLTLLEAKLQAQQKKAMLSYQPVAILSEALFQLLKLRKKDNHLTTQNVSSFWAI